MTPHRVFALARGLRPERVTLAAILLLGTGLRFLYFDAPLLDAHRWRQVDTAAIARNFYEDSFNVFYPQVDWGGRHGYVESEFPILPTLTAIAYELWGPRETAGRLVAIGFSVSAIWMMYALGAELSGRSAGRAAAFLLAVSPSAVYFGRTVMPEAPMLFFSIAGVLGFARYFRTGSRRALVWGAAAVALAWLAKLPAVVIAAPILGEAWRVKGRRIFEDRLFLCAFGLAFAVAAAWYLHAVLIYRSTGLTFGVFYSTQSYPLNVAPGPWQLLPKWSTLRTLTTPEFYSALTARLYFLHLTPAGFALAAVGWLVWRSHARRSVPDLWLLAVTAFILAVGKGNWDHDYYQIPLLPVGALYFAAAAAPAFDDAMIRRLVWNNRWASVAMASVLVGVGLLSFYLSGVTRSHFRPDSLDMRTLQAGQAIERVVPPGELVIAVEYGVNSPMLLYYAHRRGWSFDVPRMSGPTIVQLRRLGARYFATLEWSQVQAERPDVTAYLQTRQRILLDDAPSDVALFDLSQPR